jgi:hypothetical protein
LKEPRWWIGILKKVTWLIVALVVETEGEVLDVGEEITGIDNNKISSFSRILNNNIAVSGFPAESTWFPLPSPALWFCS